MATKAINSLHVTYISTTPFRTGSEQVEARPPATPVSILYFHGAVFPIFGKYSE